MTKKCMNMKLAVIAIMIDLNLLNFITLKNTTILNKIL